MLRLSGTRTSPNGSIHLRWSNEELRDGSQTDTITSQSVSDMLHTLGWRSLEHRRATSRLCILFQIYHGSIGIPHNPYILPYRHTPRPSRQTDMHTLATYQCRTNYFKCSFFPPKQLLLGMHSLNVWSLAPHWMLSRWHWGDRYQASVFEHTNLSRF